MFQGGQIALQGTHPKKTPHVVRVRNEFDVVFSFYWRDEDGNGPNATVPHHHRSIPDGELDVSDLNAVKNFAIAVAAHVEAGRRVLVRCHAGYNRSGLVVALALLELGYIADDAIALIREKRSPFALHNHHFVRYIKEAGSNR